MRPSSPGTGLTKCSPSSAMRFAAGQRGAKDSIAAPADDDDLGAGEGLPNRFDGLVDPGDRVQILVQAPLGVQEDFRRSQFGELAQDMLVHCIAVRPRTGARLPDRGAPARVVLAHVGKRLAQAVRQRSGVRIPPDQDAALGLRRLAVPCERPGVLARLQEAGPQPDAFLNNAPVAPLRTEDRALARVRLWSEALCDIPAHPIPMKKSPRRCAGKHGSRRSVACP